jgi:hypothetical protein
MTVPPFCGVVPIGTALPITDPGVAGREYLGTPPFAAASAAVRPAAPRCAFIASRAPENCDVVEAFAPDPDAVLPFVRVPFVLL